MLTYEEFRTGMTFAEVFQELKREQRMAFEREGRRMFITRRTVLGRWRQHKQRMWMHYQEHPEYFID